MTSKMQAPYLDNVCPACDFGRLELPENGQEWHLVCNDCGAIHFCYTPQPYQAAFHADPHKYKGFFGGYGSGKTTTSVQEVIKHIMETPNGHTLMGAATFQQLENTSMKDFFEMFPVELTVNFEKNAKRLHTANGHTVVFRPLDDEGKARSLNLTCFHIEEASEVKYEYFAQLQTRLRNHATDRHLGILSSNPDMGWIKDEFLYKCHEIHNSETDYPKLETNKAFSAHIAPTHLNEYLPPTYIEDTAAGKPEWWVNRYLKGSFENREGLVYPQHADNIVDPFPIPKWWPRYTGADFGWRDPTTGAFLALDPAKGILYLYDEHYESMKNVAHHAEEFHKRFKQIPPGRLERVIGDSKGKAKSERDARSLFDHYAEYDVYFEEGTKKLEDSIFKVQGYFDAGRIKIFSSCKNAIKEFQTYKYPELSLDKDIKNPDVPQDKNNHLMDAIRYVIAELPDNPDDLINHSYNPGEMVYNSSQQEQHLPQALREEPNDDISTWYAYY